MDLVYMMASERRHYGWLPFYICLVTAVISTSLEFAQISFFNATQAQLHLAKRSSETIAVHWDFPPFYANFVHEFL
jgi:hypothetical protein